MGEIKKKKKKKLLNKKKSKRDKKRKLFIFGLGGAAFIYIYNIVTQGIWCLVGLIYDWISISFFFKRDKFTNVDFFLYIIIELSNVFYAGLVGNINV